MPVTQITKVGAFTDDLAKQINDNFAALAPATGVTAGPFTTISSITVVNGVVTALTGSALLAAEESAEETRRRNARD